MAPIGSKVFEIQGWVYLERLACVSQVDSNEMPTLFQEERAAMTLTAILQLCNVALAGIAAGGQVLVLAAIVPTRWLLPQREAVQLHQETSHRIDLFMPATVVLSAVAAIMLLTPLGSSGQVADGFLVVGLFFTAVIGVLSIFVLIPINRRVSKWSIESVPAEYSAVFHRWGRMHAGRTVSAVLALVAYLLAVLAS